MRDTLRSSAPPGGCSARRLSCSRKSRKTYPLSLIPSADSRLDRARRNSIRRMPHSRQDDVKFAEVNATLEELSQTNMYL